MPLWRRIARTARWLPDRLLHPLRRRLALNRLGNRPAPALTLWVCHGNICRSPYAAALFMGKLPPKARQGMKVRSGGFIGPDRVPPAEAVRVAASRGIDVSAHRSSLITAEAVHEADLVLVMDPRQKRAVHTIFGKPYRDLLVLGDLDPCSITKRGIRDPFGQPEDVFLDSFDRLDRCVQAVVAALLSADLREQRRP